MFGKRVIVVTGLADIRRMLTLRPAKFARGLKTVGSGEHAVVVFIFLPRPFFPLARGDIIQQSPQSSVCSTFMVPVRHAPVGDIILAIKRLPLGFGDAAC